MFGKMNTRVKLIKLFDLSNEALSTLQLDVGFAKLSSNIALWETILQRNEFIFWSSKQLTNTRCNLQYNNKSSSS